MIQRIATGNEASGEAAPEQTEEAILATVERLRTEQPALSPIAAAIVAALAHGVCSDSRSFSRVFAISHAIVLREITSLSDDHALIAIMSCNERTQRTELALTPAGQALAARCTD